MAASKLPIPERGRQDLYKLTDMLIKALYELPNGAYEDGIYQQRWQPLEYVLAYIAGDWVHYRRRVLGEKGKDKDEEVRTDVLSYWVSYYEYLDEIEDFVADGAFYIPVGPQDAVEAWKASHALKLNKMRPIRTEFTCKEHQLDGKKVEGRKILCGILMELCQFEGPDMEELLSRGLEKLEERASLRIGELEGTMALNLQPLGELVKKRKREE